MVAKSWHIQSTDVWNLDTSCVNMTVRVALVEQFQQSSSNNSSNIKIVSEYAESKNSKIFLQTELSIDIQTWQKITQRH